MEVIILLRLEAVQKFWRTLSKSTQFITICSTRGREIGPQIRSTDPQSERSTLCHHTGLYCSSTCVLLFPLVFYIMFIVGHTW